MKWLEITAKTSHEDIDSLAGTLTSLGVPGLIIEDEADIEEFLRENEKYWDYVDEDFMRSIRGVSRVKFYLEDSEDGRAEFRRISAALPSTELTSRTVQDEDWENNWREYYKPIETGERLIIVPQWLPAPETSRAVLRLDPGLIFGTGAHATTKMCLAALEDYAAPGRRALDLGCGSGILAIAALILGCDSAVGVDIDDKAPGVVMENAAFNSIGPEKLRVFAGDVLSDASLSRRLGGERFHLVLANIVADVIIALAPKVGGFLLPEGVFICSGIIEGREAEVESALTGAGFSVARRVTLEGWHAFICVPGEARP